MSNDIESKVINITEKELMEIMSEETSEVIATMTKGEKSGSFSISMLLFMATFSAGIMRRIEKKMNGETKEEDLDYEPYRYSERGDK